MKYVITILFCLMLINFADGQYYQSLSNFYMNGQAVNPAYAGSREVFSANLMYRQQWVGFDGAPRTMDFGFHTPLKKLNLALGFIAYNEKVGVSRTTGFAIDYVYRIRMKEGTRNLAFGLKTGLTSFKADLSQLQLTQQGDQVFNGVILHQTKFDAGFGIYYYAPHFYFSYSLPVLSRFGYNAVQTYDSINTKVINSYLITGFIFKIGNDVQFHPSLMIKSIKNDGQVDLNLSLIVLQTLSMGLSVRSSESMALLLEYQINKQLRLGYAHDFISSPLQKVTDGTNEISLRYELIKQYNVYSTRFF